MQISPTKGDWGIQVDNVDCRVINRTASTLTEGDCVVFNLRNTADGAGGGSNTTNNNFNDEASGFANVEQASTATDGFGLAGWVIGADIPANGIGKIRVSGVVKVKPNANTTAGAGFSLLPASFQVDQTPIVGVKGIFLETATVVAGTTKVKALVYGTGAFGSP